MGENIKTADEMIADLESRGLFWSIDRLPRLIEIRIWHWPQVISRVHPTRIEPLETMLRQVYEQVDLSQYPIRKTQS